jgi:5-methylcytosine-specific restriction protein B
MKPVEGEEVEKLKKFVLIIDEINRANISKVFGELITLLEEDKRLGEENELKITLPNGEREFGVSPNLYIIGTMNTADKSIALIDIALRRRFEFIGYYPTEEVLSKLVADQQISTDKAELLEQINKEVFKKRGSADYLIGHAYFINNKGIQEILKSKIIPLLMEYFSGKTKQVSEVFLETKWKVEYNEGNYRWDISLK